MTNFNTILPVATLMLLAPVAAMAHPHVFADARLEVVAGADGNIQELHNVWRFDEVFSSQVMLDFDKNTNLVLDQPELEEIGKTVRASLEEFSYYTTLTSSMSTGRTASS
jgi:ABC-type uncharacterized transport system substrate-binding protein